MAQCERRKIYTEFWWGNPKERDSLEDLDIDVIVILKQILD
jgi:hypothetical protein